MVLPMWAVGDVEDVEAVEHAGALGHPDVFAVVRVDAVGGREMRPRNLHSTLQKGLDVQLKDGQLNDGLVGLPGNLVWYLGVASADAIRANREVAVF